MKQILATLAALAAFALPVAAQNYTASCDTTVKARYIYNHTKDPSAYGLPVSRHNIFVNEDVTTHIVMPENIKLVDISTKDIIGNQCADNIVRVKPAHRMIPNELLGTITVIGERHLAQYNVIYAAGPNKADALYNVQQEDMKNYTNPQVGMPEGTMARYAWAIYGTGRKFYDLHTSAYGIKAVVNNIYSIDDYFFIDFSLYNDTKIKYDINEIRVKLTDKKETKSTNSQTIELQPVFTLNGANSFKKAYRNVLVLNKLTFPDEKVLTLEVSENQISGRVIYLNIDYTDILHPEGFSPELMKSLEKADLLVHLHPQQPQIDNDNEEAPIYNNVYAYAVGDRMGR